MSGAAAPCADGLPARPWSCSDGARVPRPDLERFLPRAARLLGPALLGAALLGACSAGRAGRAGAGEAEPALRPLAPPSGGADGPARSPDASAGAPEPPAEAGSEAAPAGATDAAASPDAATGEGGSGSERPALDGGAPPPLPAGTKVLHVGDSFAAALGIELNHALEARGVRGLLRYKTASFIPEWASGNDLPHYMRTHDPDLVIVTLGANETAMKEPGLRAASVRKLVGVLGGRPCVWIATPLWGADNGLMAVIRANVAPCRFLDSNSARFFDDATPVRDMPRLPDKIHPTMRARARWAGFVVEWLARERAPEPGRPWALRPE
ncbi:MAG: SGNH/GDSL hydrolase family protein [Polyangiaceae bacterium]|nr:SGNH/GDSL hydrolase family protein [Polyangiaceae bacterium]